MAQETRGRTAGSKKAAITRVGAAAIMRLCSKLPALLADGKWDMVNGKALFLGHAGAANG